MKPYRKTNILQLFRGNSCNGVFHMFLGKPLESDSARLGHIPSLPWESQLPLKPFSSLQPSDLKGNCDSLRFSLRFLLQFHGTVRFASQMWATRPHLGSIFKKLLHRKIFHLPAARSRKVILLLLLSIFHKTKNRPSRNGFFSCSRLFFR